MYFGGGTPTALATTDLVRLISACKRYLPLTDDCEITLEGRISHFDPDKAQACIDAGINRISIGIQSFDDHIRKRMGRKHSGDEAWHYLQQMCALDCVVVADLIYGLPNQNDDIWARDITRINQLPLSGLDTYAFSNFPACPSTNTSKKATCHRPPRQPSRHNTTPTPANNSPRTAGNKLATNTTPGRGGANATATTAAHATPASPTAPARAATTAATAT